MTPSPRSSSDSPELSLCLSAALKESVFSYSRSAGPGGQNVNKSNTKATLRWSVKDSELPDVLRKRLESRLRLNKSRTLMISCQQHRSQEQNARQCRLRLKQMIAEALVRRRARIATHAGPAAHERRLRTKQAVSQNKRARTRVTPADAD